MVLASGQGTLFHAILDAVEKPNFPARIIALGVDRPCHAQSLAQGKGVDSYCLPVGQYSDRPQWDAAFAAETLRYSPDVVISAGFMRILGERFLTCFGDRTINTHPALLPAFPGAHAVRDALNYGVKWTGSTIHLVDQDMDTGPILVQEPVRVFPDDNEDSLHERIKEVERRLLVSLISDIAANGITHHITRRDSPSQSEELL